MKEFEIKFDVLFIGAGIASLSSAYHLKRLIKKHNKENTDKISNITIGVLEKGQYVGAHILSGAVIEPAVLDEFMPDWKDTDIPVKNKVSKDSMYFLTPRGRIKLPFSPPGMSNSGNYIISLTELVKWLEKKCEEEQIEIYTSEPVEDIIVSGEKLIGLKTKDRGIDKEQNKKINYLPQSEVAAKIIVIGEGAHGFIAKKLIDKFNLNKGRNPQNYATGIKELWEIKPENFTSGSAIHTFGYPMDYKTYGGGFIYHHKDNFVSVGFAVALDYQDPYLNLHESMQKFKTNPLISKMLKGGKLIEYGAKVIPEGGYYSIGSLCGPSFMIIGDSAGLVNSKKLKGIHLAIKSGMLAAEVIFEALKKEDFSFDQISKYDKKIKNSWINKELYSVRNFHQAFQKGNLPAMFHIAFQTVTGGRGILDRFNVTEDYLHLKKLSESFKKPNCFQPDGILTFDRLTEVFFSGVKHEEDQPPHLKIKEPDICTKRCTEEFGNPCTLLCPAKVYNMAEEDGRIHLEIDFTNCLHCKTCEIKDPYNIVQWVPPEGGGGPSYNKS